MKRLILILSAMGMTIALVGTAAAEGPPRKATVPVGWHMQAGGPGVVEGAWAKLVATSSGASVTFQTRELEPGHAYTLWYVIVNNPAACADSPCSPADVFNNSDAHAQVTYGAGNVVGESGQATFSARLNVGPVDGWLPDRTFHNPLGAEYHFVVNDHGPKIAEHMPEMIRTYRGGCSDASPFPPIFPDAALADGEPGPNTCILTQAAIFQP